MKSLALLSLFMLLLAFVFSGFLTPLASISMAQSVAPEEGNQVQVGFGQHVQSWFSRDSFTNKELTGLMLWRIASIRNTDDKTGAPVKDLRVTLNSELAFDGAGPWETRTKMGPPVYEWSYGDLVEESQHKGTWIDAAVSFNYYTTTIRPGFDASRSLDKTLFTTPDTQTLTITVTPREEWLERLGVEVIADEKNAVNSIITSYSSTEAENIKFTVDRHRLFLDCIPVELNTPLTITVTLLVTPKVPEVEYKPCLGVWPEVPRQTDVDVGTTSGSSVSYNMTEVGTWTVSAEGNYLWNWTAPRWVGSMVIFAETPEPRIDPALFADSPVGPHTTTSIPIKWPILIIGIIVIIGIIIGLTTYLFIRRQRRA